MVGMEILIPFHSDLPNMLVEDMDDSKTIRNNNIYLLYPII